MKELDFPFDAEFVLRKKKSLKRGLLEREGVKYLNKKIAILGGSTTENIKLMLELFLLNNGIAPEFYESEYNRYWEDAVFGTPELDEFKPDLIYIHTTTRNLKAKPDVTMSAEDVDAVLDAEYKRFEAMWEKIEERYGCIVIQNNFELPYYRLLGNSDVSDIHGLSNFLARLNMKFSEYAQTHEKFHINDIHYISAEYGIKEWSDPADWYRYKYNPCVAATPDLAYNVARIVKALYGKNKKAIACDLDNTLWGGIVGDDGPENIKIGQEDAVSELYEEFQGYIKAHRDLGILLTVASKNDEENALAGLARPDGVLKKDDFLIIKANWENKNTNIANTAAEINIGADAFVFIDDNPMERNIVESTIEGIAVPDFGDPESYIRTMDGAGYFEVTGLSADDLKRNEMYKANISRATAAASFTDYTEYLKSLDMKAEILPFSPMYMARITELTNKSNQFNLTTRRCTQAETESFANDPDYITLYGKLVDKFGDNGVVSVVFGHINKDVSTDGCKVFDIDLWLMSCRVLKRDMECAMMDELVRLAKEKGVDKIRGFYYPTAKNKMVKEFYADRGYTKVSEDEEGNTVWELATAGYENKNKVIAVN
ncbi:MAG: HAD-IIIC family phosphatase [Clostridiales bacterium]|nr:HAD-IIIC family phosphatase [Clostridiales bacterium]